MSKLTPTQLSFIRNLFGKAAGNMKEAAKLTLGTEEYVDLLTDDLLEAIKKRADDEIVLNVPKAVFLMSKILEQPESIPFLDKLHKVAADVLDRAGLSRRERASAGVLTVGIVMLPNKTALPEIPHVETIEQAANPLSLPA